MSAGVRRLAATAAAETRPTDSAAALLRLLNAAAARWLLSTSAPAALVRTAQLLTQLIRLFFFPILSLGLRLKKYCINKETQ